MIAHVETDTDLTAYLTRLDTIRAERLASEGAGRVRRTEEAMTDFDFMATAESVIQRYGRPVWPEAQVILDLLRAGSRRPHAHRDRECLMAIIRQIEPVPDRPFTLHRSMIGAYGGQTSR